MRTFGWLAAGLFVAAGAAGCKFPYPADVPDDDATGMRALGGSVTGLWTGGAVTLHLAAGDVTEDLAATATAPFAFTARLLDGESYRVTVADDGPDHDCVVTNGSGRVDGADIADLAVACTNLIPHGLAISTPVAFTFDPRVTRYPLAVSILQQEVTVTVTGATLTSVKVAGQTVTLGQPSPAAPLGQGMTTIAIDVVKGPLSQRYELVFDRGAAPIVEALYARASNAGTDDFFGSSVAAWGEYAAIGARWEDSSTPAGDNNAVTNTGAVYVFRRGGDTWVQRQILKGSSVTPNREFGEALAMEDDLLVVGARRDDAGGMDAGAAHIFRLNRATAQWTEEQRLVLPSPRAGDWFGYSVAISGGTVAIGCPLCEVSGVRDAGIVHVYERSGGTWASTGQIRLVAPADNDCLGTRFSLDGDTIATAGGCDMLAPSPVRIFRRSGATWTQEVSPPDTFGVSALHIRGDTLAIGDPTDASGNGQPGDTGAPGSGAVILMGRSGTVWARSSFLKATTPVVGAGLGPGVAMGRDLVLTSAPGQERIQPFQRVGGSWIPLPTTSPSVTGQTSALGTTFAATGDFLFATQELDRGPGGGYFGAVFVFK